MGNNNCKLFEIFGGTLMFRNRTFKFLSYLILLVVLCAGQVAAAPGNNANKVEKYSSSPFINCAAQTQIPDNRM